MSDRKLNQGIYYSCQHQKLNKCNTCISSKRERERERGKTIKLSGCQCQFQYKDLEVEVDLKGGLYDENKDLVACSQCKDLNHYASFPKTLNFQGEDKKVNKT